MSCAEIYQIRTKNAENSDMILFTSKSKYGLHCINFYNTHNGPMAPTGDPNEMTLKSLIVWKLIHNFTWRTKITEETFNKMTFALQHFVSNSKNQFYEYSINILGLTLGHNWTNSGTHGRTKREKRWALRIKRSYLLRKERLQTKHNNDNINKDAPCGHICPPVRPWRRHIYRNLHLHSYRSSVSK